MTEALRFLSDLLLCLGVPTSISSSRRPTAPGGAVPDSIIDSHRPGLALIVRLKALQRLYLMMP